MTMSGDMWAARVGVLEVELHHWRGLFTPVKTELQLLKRTHPLLSREIDEILALLKYQPRAIAQ